MSLLDQAIPAHTCSRCNILFGQIQGISKHHNENSGSKDRSKRVTLYIIPSKRPYVIPFRRVQTFERFVQYISTLPHPQISLVTSANPAKPKFRACEELLYAGQWQLLDPTGCIIRPDDWEELVYDGMDISLDTIPFEQETPQESGLQVLQPMQVATTNKTNENNGQWNRPSEAVEDLLEFQSTSKPFVHHVDIRDTHSREFVPYQNRESLVYETIPYQTPKTYNDVVEVEAAEPPAPTFVMPPKPAPKSIPWVKPREKKSNWMSPSAEEFTPSMAFDTPAAGQSARDSTAQTPTEMTKTPADDSIFQLPQSAVVKKSKAIPIVRPPSPPLTARAVPPVPDVPDTFHTYDDDKEEEERGATEEDDSGKVEEKIEKEAVTLESPVEPPRAAREAVLYKEESESGWGDDTFDAPDANTMLEIERAPEAESSEVVNEKSSDSPRGEQTSLRPEVPVFQPRDQAMDRLFVDEQDDTVGSNRGLSPGPENKFDGENGLFDDDIHSNSDYDTGNVIKSDPVEKKGHTDTVTVQDQDEVAEKPQESQETVGAEEAQALIEAPVETEADGQDGQRGANSGREQIAETSRRAMDFHWGDEEPDTGEEQRLERSQTNEDGPEVHNSEESRPLEIEAEEPAPEVPEPRLPEWQRPKEQASQRTEVETEEPKSSAWETEKPKKESKAQEMPSWQTTEPDEPDEEWNSWQSTVVEDYDTQWNSKGIVPVPLDTDSEWAPKSLPEPEPQKSLPSVWNTGNLPKPAWNSVASASQRVPAPSKKEIVIKNPNTGAVVVAPPSPSNSSIATRSVRPGKVQPQNVYIIHFVPSDHTSSPRPEKLSYGIRTPIRKVAQGYARSCGYRELLSFADDMNTNPVFEFVVSKRYDGPQKVYSLAADKRLDECGFGNEFWVSVTF